MSREEMAQGLIKVFGISEEYAKSFTHLIGWACDTRHMESVVQVTIDNVRGCATLLQETFNEFGYGYTDGPIEQKVFLTKDTYPTAIKIEGTHYFKGE